MIEAADIRATRARLNETQEQFGQRFGVSRFHVMNWERYGIGEAPEVERIISQLLGLTGETSDAGRDLDPDRIKSI